MASKKAKTKQIGVTAEMLYDIQLISEVSLSPDGTKILYRLSRVDKNTEKKFSNLWIAPTNGNAPYQITQGDHMDSGATWSPSGKKIAFFSNRKDPKQSEIHVMTLGRGEAQCISQLKGHAMGIQWAPNGKSLYFSFKGLNEQQLTATKDEKAKKLGTVYRHYKGLSYKFDGAGWLNGEKWQIANIKLANSKFSILDTTNLNAAAAGNYITDVVDAMNPKISPDGKWIAYTSNRLEDPDRSKGLDQLWLYEIESGISHFVPSTIAYKHSFSFSPDGKQLAFLSNREAGQWWMNTDIFVLDLSDHSMRRISKDLEHDCSGITLNDMGGTPEVSPPVWTPDAQHLFYMAGKHGSNTIHKINVASGVSEALFTEKGSAGSISVDKKQQKLAFLHSQMDDIGQIKFISLDSGSIKTLSKNNQKLFAKTTLGVVEEVWFKGEDGNDLQGWIVKPPNFDPKKKYPSILEIHGGPLMQYGESFMHEFQYLAAKGYVVFFCNPRGGRGYGEEHAKAIWNNWGTADYADLMSFTDLIEKKDYIDTERMGVTGGSYGGYMTNWIIGNTQRFKAAVTQRCVSNLVSMWGSSDGNTVFQQVFGNQPPYENLENFWRMSPIRLAANFKTPTLVIHSEHDFRCCLEQGEQMYVALRSQGIPSELVIFPNEPHGLSRNGRTDRRIARLDFISGWFDKYL